MAATQGTDWMFIHAICIDQTNHLEKSQPVTHMEAIYFRAHQVDIWLGAEPSIENFLRWLKRHSNSLDRLHSEVIVAQVSELIGDPALHQAYMTIEKHRHWTCLWALVEATNMARHAVCAGDQMISFPKLWQSLSIFKQHVSPGPSNGKDIATFQKDLRKPYALKRHCFLDNLKLLNNYRCTESRDIVHALRLVSSDGSRFPMDYTITTQERFVRLLAWFSNRLILFCPEKNEDFRSAMRDMLLPALGLTLQDMQNYFQGRDEFLTFKGTVVVPKSTPRRCKDCKAELVKHPSRGIIGQNGHVKLAYCCLGLGRGGAKHLLFQPEQNDNDGTLASGKAWRAIELLRSSQFASPQFVQPPTGNMINPNFDLSKITFRGSPEHRKTQYAPIHYGIYEVQKYELIVLFGLLCG